MEGEEEVSIKRVGFEPHYLQRAAPTGVVRQLLSEDPRNSEYADMEKELKELADSVELCFSFLDLKGVLVWGHHDGQACVCLSPHVLRSIPEVIALTEELLATAKQNEISLSDAGATSDSPNNLLEGAWRQMESRNDPIHEGKFPMGTKVQAVFSEDGEWYEATVEARDVNVDPDNVRAIENNALLEAERLAEATKNALKRKIEQAASSDYQSKTLPAKLKIDPNDPEDVRKKIHAFKSKARQEQLEVAQNKKQNAWQQFQTTKAKTKKVGFFTGRKKESIFKSPEDPFGKVGVIGSGKGLTDFQKREKHLHLKSGNAEGTDV
ncbi:hypothetical protein IGI04_007933 [Brassica rapa subsp. trilocularis]|uniref:Tudor domain-containing protein n=1 Tax=Brassica rapa subsp. trilocularis TaxID=1813537 RepID=A0ABQ7NPG8_BRACM|nr:hypothetical protein IGI04_007933 [Brassica rapa subsp. trilocularis]